MAASIGRFLYNHTTDELLTQPEHAIPAHARNIMGKSKTTVNDLLSIRRISDDQVCCIGGYIDIVVDENTGEAWVYGGSATGEEGKRAPSCAYISTLTSWPGTFQRWGNYDDAKRIGDNGQRGLIEVIKRR